MKIYVPEKENYECYVVQSEGVIRAYEEKPTQNRIVNYRDYYIESDYIYKDGTQQFSSYSNTPTCLSSDVITSEVYYRNDFDSILIIFLILCIIFFWFPLKLITRIFKRWSL